MSKEVSPVTEAQTAPPVVEAPVVTDSAAPAIVRVYMPEVTSDDEDPEIEMSPEEALDIVREIEHEILDETDDVALMTSMDQRLYIGAWIFRARAVQESFLADEKIEGAVHKIAQRLTTICKHFWPGSVRALQVNTTPSQGLDGLVPRKIARSWAEAAKIVEQEIDVVSRQPGRDDYGWRDAAQMFPEPPNADGVLQEALDKIESLVGPANAGADGWSTRVDRTRLRENINQLVEAAQLLRWIRRAVSKRRTWGLAIGALRRACREIGPEHNDTLRAVLSDGFKPPRSWAEMLGRDPKVNHRARLQREVLQTIPLPGLSRASLIDWLAKAFQVFTNPQIAKLVTAVKVDVLALTNEDFSEADRNTRSRLRRLHTILRTEQDMSRVELPSVPESKHDESAPPSDKTEPNADPAEALLAQVRPYTTGKRLLFVSNRPDENLRERMEKDLCCEVDFRDGDNPKRLRAIVDSVSPQSYDFVLMATGFASHNADALLCRAAKSSGIPYIRVSKGRPLATIRALARVLNLPECAEPA
jgi:hypothetical protein